MSAITTHVLDTVLGKPAAGIRVRLEAMEGGGWIEVSVGDKRGQRLLDVPGNWIDVSSSVTDADGRCRDLGDIACEGAYRLTFETGKYFAREGRGSIYPEISVTFIARGDAHYHLPLLLTDNSYTTYRGS